MVMTMLKDRFTRILTFVSDFPVERPLKPFYSHMTTCSSSTCTPACTLKQEISSSYTSCVLHTSIDQCSPFLQSRDNLISVIVTPGQILHNKYGRYLHDDMVGMKYGAKVSSMDYLG